MSEHIDDAVIVKQNGNVRNGAPMTRDAFFSNFKLGAIMKVAVITILQYSHSLD